MSGTPIYLAPSAFKVIVGSQTVHLQQSSPSSHQPIIIGRKTLTAQSDRSGYIINGQTIQPGSPAITIAGKSVSLDPSKSTLIIDGHALRPGYPAITVSGIVISLESSSASTLVIISGTKSSLLTPFTTPAAAATATSISTSDQPGLGDLIMGGFNSATATTTEKKTP